MRLRGSTVLLTATIAFGAAGVSGCRPGGASASKSPSRATTAVTLVSAEMRPMERTLAVLGSLAAMDQATVGIKTTGRLKWMPVDVGSVVQAGDVLTQIEPRDYELRVQQAAALLGQARARLGLPIEGDDDRVEPDRINSVRETRALLEEARKNLDRVRALQDQGISSEVEFERANAEHLVTLNRYEATLQDVRERQAVLAQRRAEYDIARQQLNDTSVRAPFDGVVQERLANVGEFVASGSPVMRLVRVNPLRLRLDIPERRAAGIREGQAVRVGLEGDSRRYEGRIQRVSPALDEVKRMLVVEAELPNPGHLRPGAFAKAEIVLAEATPTLAIPEESLATFAGSEKALLVVSNRVVERSVRTGRRNIGWIEVTSGLEAGDSIVRHPGGLRTGDPVRVGNEDASPTSAVSSNPPPASPSPAPGKNS